MIETTTARVPWHTSEALNRRLAADVEARLAYYASHRGKTAFDANRR